MTRPKVVVIGLDCAPPSLIFDELADSLPNLSALRQRGVWGPLRSSAPPITVPAWTCMVTGRDAGELGLYGFRCKDGYDMRIATSQDVSGVKRVWDLIGEAGYRVASLFVPLTSPATPVNGTMVSCFLTDGSNWTFPPAYAETFEQKFGEYKSDVESFRDGDLARIEAEIFAMTDQHFDVALDVLKSQDPDFLMMVEMGPDRLHHAFWHLFSDHSASGPFSDVHRRYYSHLDAQVGRVVAEVGDDAVIIIVSDHGARSMEGGFCINDWLIHKGYLHLLQPVNEGGTVVKSENIDWSKTKAWATGGYYARIFLNVEGREEQGVIPRLERERFRERLTQELLQDAPKGSMTEYPDTCYRVAKRHPPDIMVYFADLAVRSIGSVGHPTLLIDKDDRGEDGCNHDWNGIFIGAMPDGAVGEIEGAQIYDIAQTVLQRFELESQVGGRDLLNE